MAPTEYREAFEKYGVRPSYSVCLESDDKGTFFASAIGIRLVAACGGIEEAFTARNRFSLERHALASLSGLSNGFVLGLSHGWEYKGRKDMLLYDYEDYVIGYTEAGAARIEMNV